MEQCKINAMAKINLLLDVVRRREDGYHEVRMIMQTVNLYDTLLLKRTKGSGIVIHTEQEGIPTDERNLIYKTAQLITKQFGLKEGVTVDLVKRIPVAAGMAGGSTDAAAVFHGMNRLFDLNMSVDEMCRLGVKIGADVPYCIVGGTVLAEGIGEKLTRLKNAPDCVLLIAKPEISVSTKYVYDNLHADTLCFHPDCNAMLSAIESVDKQSMLLHMGNVLETVTIPKYPVIEQIKNVMKSAGAENALMSGSGPTVFGIFEDKSAAEGAAEELKKTGLAKQIMVTTFIDTTCI